MPHGRWHMALGYVVPLASTATGLYNLLSEVCTLTKEHEKGHANLPFNEFSDTLCTVIGEGVHSMIEDERVDWAEGAAQVTPAAELHSHHNRGDKRMVSLVVQDEGLHFYARTPGFSWT